MLLELDFPCSCLDFGNKALMDGEMLEVCSVLLCCLNFTHGLSGLCLLQILNRCYFNVLYDGAMLA